MKLSKIAILVSSVGIGLGLAACSSDDNSNPQVSPDASVDGPDAGGEPQRACSEMTLPVGRELTVTCDDGEPIKFEKDVIGNFETMFDADIFLLWSEDGRYILQLDVHPNDLTCPRSYALPFGPEDADKTPFDLWILDSDTFATARASNANSTGNFRLDGYSVVAGAREVSYTCSNCSLSGASKGGVPIHCTVDGTFREVAVDFAP